MSLATRGRNRPRPGEATGERGATFPRRARESGMRTALQKHVDFFDTSRDGKITLATLRGLRRLGLGARARLRSLA